MFKLIHTLLKVTQNKWTINQINQLFIRNLKVIYKIFWNIKNTFCKEIKHGIVLLKYT